MELERTWPEQIGGETRGQGGIRTRSVLTRITAYHLAHGIPRSPTMCALALAMTDAGFMEPHIEHGAMTVKGLDGMAFEVPASLHLDPVVLGRIRAFDKREPVEPFEIYLNIYAGLI